MPNWALNTNLIYSKKEETIKDLHKKLENGFKNHLKTPKPGMAGQSGSAIF